MKRRGFYGSEIALLAKVSPSSSFSIGLIIWRSTTLGTLIILAFTTSMTSLTMTTPPVHYGSAIGPSDELVAYLEAKKPKTLLSQATSLAHRINRKWVDSKFYRVVHDAIHDREAGMWQEKHARWNSENLWISLRHYSEFTEPFDIDIIFAHTRRDSDRSCQRAILEICALKMTNAERTELMECTGSRFGARDGLYLALRQPYYCPESVRKLMDVELIVLRQKWYKESWMGERRIIEFLFDIISSNPAAFCHFLAK